jgi:type IV secretory pathway VirB10-like protein
MNSNVLIAVVVIAVVIGVFALIYFTQPAQTKAKEPLPSPSEIMNYTPQVPENISPPTSESNGSGISTPQPNETNASVTIPEINESELEIQLPDEI